ncbi:PREDICTED: uncharacterized protein LOC109325195 [Lupinus angustifolius]|uniref:uncharacterized protein LOC109325195 n=1 Tax=Lupinus angustifolius TaxID=3871 RepID=UPI00092F6FE5|nr:PREDICTED: uncharacterized protein LOC109325195 [Lupinus angustifolius]
MEEKEDENLENMDLKSRRTINFNVPLLSTRRLGCSVVADTSCTLQNTRVPFSWEQAPGKPKDIERSSSVRDGDTPRLRLPPCLWHQLKEAVGADIDNGIQARDECIASNAESDLEVFGHDLTHGSFESPVFQPTVMTDCVKQRFLEFDQDDGCDGDDDDDDDDVLLDAMDVLSLSEALDIVQLTEKVHSESNDGLRLKLAECNGDQSPAYMINRFLPDATALAASSSINCSNDFNKKMIDTASYASSSKGCGPEILFPWSMKHKLCAIKSHILPYSKKSVQKHQHSSKHKKHCSSIHKVCTNNVK